MPCRSMPCRSSPFSSFARSRTVDFNSSFFLLICGAMANYRRTTEDIMDRDKDHFGHPWEQHKDSKEDSLQKSKDKQTDRKERMIIEDNFHWHVLFFLSSLQVFAVPRIWCTCCRVSEETRDPQGQEGRVPYPRGHHPGRGLGLDELYERRTHRTWSLFFLLSHSLCTMSAMRWVDWDIILNLFFTFNCFVIIW